MSFIPTWKYWSPPKKVHRGADLFNLTPKGRWYYERSKQRALLHQETHGWPFVVLMQGEIGRIESFRIIESGAELGNSPTN